MRGDATSTAIRITLVMTRRVLADSWFWIAQPSKEDEHAHVVSWATAAPHPHDFEGIFILRLPLQESSYVLSNPENVDHCEDCRTGNPPLSASSIHRVRDSRPRA